MPWTDEKWAAYKVWVQAWLAERPELLKLSKKAQWQLANTAWLEMRRHEKAAERQRLKSLDARYSGR
jgi:hypothetical protein